MLDREFNKNHIGKWFENNGDGTLRINYNLTKDSVIMDLGGYHGDWTNIMINKYNCTSHVFEPVESLVNIIAGRFSGDKRVSCYDVAVGDEKKKVKIYHGADESSLFSIGNNEAFEIIKMMEVSDVLNKIGLDFVDLVKINIEGGEFDLLDAIIDKGLQTKFGNFQIQFHKVEDDSVERRDKIHEELSKTHVCNWNYPWVWENWQLK